LEREIPKVEENLSKRLTTKEDLYKVKEELKEDIYRIERELITVKILLWVVVILSGASFFPQLLNLLKVLK